jgi:prepilin-type N-terminal cleavage/methylation domain-containing protein
MIARTGQPVCGQREQGFTLIELLVTAAISVLIIAGLGEVIQATVRSKAVLNERIDITRQASFAMERMVRAVSHSRRLLLPLNDNPGTNWPEDVREETVPPTPPIGDSTLATAVLAVTLPAYVDLDFDGVPDADDDGDGLTDEDLRHDNHHDFAPGIMLIDDDGDGSLDEGGWADDDEDGTDNDDPLDGIDNDGDGSIDEDPAGDNRGDGCPGLCGVDDDGDAQVDEGANEDDDEDGEYVDDDNYDPVVFYLDSGALMERMPVPWNEDGISTPNGPVDGRDFVASPIAENVTRLRIERLPTSGSGAQLVDITLDLTGANGQTISLNRRVSLGGAL